MSKAGDSLGTKVSEKVGQLFSTGTVILFACDATGDFPILSVSENTKAILGFEPDYFLEHTHGWSNRIHPNDRERSFNRFKEVVKEGSGVISEYRFKTKRGEYIWLRDELKLIEEEDGHSVIYGSSIDITERKKAEIALRENKDQYQSVVEHIKDITFSVNAEGKLTFLNDAWEQRTGYRIEESYGQTFCNFIHADDRKACRKMFRQLAEEKKQSDWKILKCIKKDGSIYWGEVYAKRLDEKVDNTFNITGTIIDVSEDIARRKEVEDINEQLEERVQQRSQELEQEVRKRQRVEQQLQQRLDYEKAISQCSKLLLENNSTEALRKSLQTLLDATGTDRVYMYRNKRIKGELHLQLEAEVCAEDVDSVRVKGRPIYKYADIPWWHNQLSNQQIISAQVDEIDHPVQSTLEDKNVKSVLVIPIMVDQEWYGYVGFADTKKKRIWSDNDISLLKTTASIIGAFKKQKKIQKSLIQQRIYTESILDSLPSVYLLINKDLQIVQWNLNAEEVSGYKGQELKNRSLFEFVAPEDHAALRKAMVRLQKRQGIGAELDMLTKNDEQIPYFWNGQNITLGEERFFLCIGIDISMQKDTERALLYEKRFNESLIESLPGIFYMIDEERNYHRWNQNFVDQLGYSADEIKEMTPADFYTDEEFERISAGMEQVYKTGEAEVDTHILTKSGNEIPYHLTGKLFRRRGEEYLIGVGFDITEQVEARKELKKSEELFRNLFLEAPIAIAMSNSQSKVIRINDSFKDLFGYTEEEIKGKSIDKLIVPEAELNKDSDNNETGYESERCYKEARRIAKDGSIIDVFVAGVPVYVEGNRVAGFGMYIDISEQKRFESEIQESLEEKKVLLQEIHHRVKNNLAVISGLIQLQVYETEDPVVKETLRVSENRIQTMALIHEKLYKSKSLSRISLATYIKDLVEVIRNTISTNKDISVAIDIDDVELTINKAVPFALLVNEVLTNSFKYAFEGRDEGTIEIRVHTENNRIHAVIQDDGIGLPADILDGKEESLGMTLIQNFIRQLDADSDMGNDQGMYIKLDFSALDTRGSSASKVL